MTDAPSAACCMSVSRGAATPVARSAVWTRPEQSIPARVRPPQRYGVPTKRSATATKSASRASIAARCGSGMKAPIARARKAVLLALDGHARTEGQVDQRRRFDVGPGHGGRRQRGDLVRRRTDCARDRGGGDIADIAVRVRLHPRPALMLLEHADRLAETGVASSAPRRHPARRARARPRPAPAPASPSTNRAAATRPSRRASARSAR